MIYPNGVRLPIQMANELKVILGNPASDHLFINKTFSMFFTDNYIKEFIKDGIQREDVLSFFRQSDQYEILKSKEFGFHSSD